ncbi:MAG: hypothetical protein Q9O24_10385 [Gammaproteobacteria bacterium]|nr:hypothetical protein [Gammaproteobacteria bacterium]
MHAKLFAAKSKESMCIYLGSGNLTNRAVKSNIETGVLLTIAETKKSMEYINELIGKCEAKSSVEDIIRKSMYSHFYSELLFLALDESKMRQCIFVSPSGIKKIISDLRVSDSGDEGVVNIKSKRSLSISVLKDDDRVLLLKKEKEFKNEIKKHFAIKLDAYGWVTSRWSLGRVLNEDHPIGRIYIDFIDEINSIRNKYKNIEYRESISDEIREYILGWVHNEGGELSGYQRASIDGFLDKFDFDISDTRSPYRKIERLFDKISGRSDIVSLLNPYKIGDSGVTENDCEFSLLSSDQINLLVMCELAIKLRYKQVSLNIPSVWWFDVGLDKDIHNIYGYDSLSRYKEDTRMKLESIVLDIQEASSSSELDRCMDSYCEITGFNLAMKYPEMSELLVNKNIVCVDGSVESLDKGVSDECPYVFIEPSKIRYNLEFKDGLESDGVIIAFDKNEALSRLEMDESDLEKIKGKFVLGGNLKFYFDLSSSSMTHLYIDSLTPQDIE